MSKSTPRALRVILVVGLVWTAAATARAAQTLEFNFRTAPVGSTVAASEWGAGVPNTATLVDNASMDTGTAVGVGVKYDARFGYYTNADRTNDRLETAATYNQIFDDSVSGINNFGRGAAVVVVKPDVNWGGARHWFFHHAAFSGVPNALSFLTEGSPMIMGGRGTENAFFLPLTAPAGVWDPNTWYFIGASWQQSSAAELVAGPDGWINGLNDGSLRIYMRTLKVGANVTPNSTINFASADNVSIWNTRPGVVFYNETLNLGNRNDASATEAALGDFALFRFYDTLFSQADFDNAFQSLLPEPGTATALVVAGVVCLMRRRDR